MKNMFAYWAIYGLVELIIYVWLFQWIGFWPLLLIQIFSTAMGVYMFKKSGRNTFKKYFGRANGCAVLARYHLFFLFRTILYNTGSFNHFNRITSVYSVC
ncbi:exclusion suppressor FxsA [Listeria aquatica FSL S10-1188]|uniref:Exclusion suppressor FxsA n=1 Tax=Listeria aquatica FSL S10-1188 TaxID=1265818 RepID=W7BCS9_9LIST|nr:exclusion suppressor FxsA [Listeria aquatica FSL S10-1188]